MFGPGRNGASALAALLLAACSQQTSETAQPAPPADAPAVPASQTPPQPAALEVLSNDDVRNASLGGELGCTFAQRPAEPLLIAYGFVASPNEPANGVIKVGSAATKLQAPGGFDGLVNGAAFTGSGATAVIALTGPAQGGGESPPIPATLTYQPADGASLTVAGTWTCGP